MKVLLCLVSDQHVPNLLSVHHFCPDRLVLIESTAMKRKRAAENLHRALRAGSLDYDDERCRVLPLNDVNNLSVIRATLQQAYGLFPSADWIANVTGGMKPMSIAAYEFFKALGARVVYVDAAKPEIILNLDEGSAEHCPHPLSIPEFLAGYGFVLSKDEDAIREAESRADAWWPCARVIAQMAPDANLLHTANRDEWKQVREKTTTLEPHHFAKLPTEVIRAIRDCFKLDSAEGSLTGRIDKYAGKFLTGEWLEHFIWKLLKTHAEALELTQVRLGVEAKRDDAPTDFDVAFMRKHALGAAECKSGTQEQGNDPIAPLDKLEARMQQFRALRVNPILVTTAKQILDSAGSVKATFATRAAIYGCRIVTLNAIQSLAARAGDIELVRQTFFPRPPGEDGQA